jgi:4'-phosphopantetheinyl transferase
MLVRLWMAWVADLRPHHLALLDQPERDRLERFVRPADAARSGLGAVLVRVVAADHLGATPQQVTVVRRCPRCGLDHGKPKVAGGPQLSLAHSGDLVVVATADAPIGVDVEDAGRPWPLAAPGADPAGARLVWTRREAVVKAIGDGRAVTDDDPLVTGAAHPARLLHAAACDPECCAMTDLDLPPGYVGAVAVLAPGTVRVQADWATALLDRWAPAS